MQEDDEADERETGDEDNSGADLDTRRVISVESQHAGGRATGSSSGALREGGGFRGGGAVAETGACGVGGGGLSGLRRVRQMRLQEGGGGLERGLGRTYGK